MENQSHEARLAVLRKKAETRSDELLVEAVAELEAQRKLIALLRDELDLSAAIEKAFRPKTRPVRKTGYSNDLDGAVQKALASNARARYAPTSSREDSPVPSQPHDPARPKQFAGADEMSGQDKLDWAAARPSRDKDGKPFEPNRDELTPEEKAAWRHQA